MARGSRVQVEGLSRVVRDLQRFGVEVEDLRDAFSRIGEQVKPDYERVTPRVTGTLRGDYRVSKAKGKTVLYVGRASIPYGGPINYGWPARNIAPRNFIAKGDVTAAPKANRSLEREISRLVSQLNLS